MNIPGFAADSSLYKSCQVYHSAGPMREFLNKVVPQQICDAGCLDSCYFDCVGACDDPSNRGCLSQCRANCHKECCPPPCPTTCGPCSQTCADCHGNVTTRPC
jgi:hypothetical protein